jgi:long-chain acyl-CoA synthetase
VSGHTTLAPLEALADLAQRTPHAAAVIAGERGLTYAALDTEVGTAAEALSTHGVQAGDRVIIHLPNGLEAAVGYLACWQIGAIAVPVNAQLTAAEIDTRVKAVSPRVYLGEPEGQAVFNELNRERRAGIRWMPLDLAAVSSTTTTSSEHQAPDAATAPNSRLDEDSVAALIATTGSTGSPKLAILTHRAISHIGVGAADWGVSAEKVVICALPLSHNSGLSVLVTCLLSGAPLVIVPVFDAEAALDAIEAHHGTQLSGIPAFFESLVNAQRQRARDVSTLEACFCGGDVIPPRLARDFEAALGCPALSIWVATEEIAASAPGPHPGAVSRPLPDVRLRFVDDEGRAVAAGAVGRMFTQSPRTSPGYWQPDGTIQEMEDGWFDSGDLMRMDDDGLLHYVGRVKDVIVHGGHKISPVEVEEVIQRHPGVEIAAVVGLPDSDVGQRPVAALKLAEETDDGVVDEVRELLETNLADWRRPQKIIVVDELPRNALTKVDRAALAAQLAEG